MSRQATAIAVFRADYTKVDAVLAWQAEIDTAAAKWPGFIESSVTTATERRDDWAAAVTFNSERKLRAWLDSTDRDRFLQQGAALGVSTIAATIVLVEGERPPPGVVVFLHRVAPIRQPAFRRAESRLLEIGRSFPGFLGAVLLPPGDVRGVWISILRYDNDHNLNHWLNSPERVSLLENLRRQLDSDFESYTRSTPFGSIIRFEGDNARVTPKWKVAMVVLLVLYPTVMLLARFVTPFLADLGADPGLALWLSQVVSTGLLTWVAMPLATRILRRWLDPIDGASAQVTITGALLIMVLYVLTLAVFLSVPELQFWNRP